MIHSEGQGQVAYLHSICFLLSWETRDTAPVAISFLTAQESAVVVISFPTAQVDSYSLIKEDLSSKASS